MSSKPTVPRIRVLVVRHGETKENVARIIQGQLDTDLNKRGRDQAKRTAVALKDERIDEIYASPLKRARETAEAILSSQTESPSFILDDRLKERGFGSLEGKIYSGTKRDSIEGIESMTSLTERLASFWNDVISGKGPWGNEEKEDEGQASRSNETSGNGHAAEAKASETSVKIRERTILLVAHGAALSALLNEVLLSGGYLVLAPGVTPTRFWNCSVTELYSPSISTQVSSPISKFSAGHPSRRNRWTVRPSHLNPRSNLMKSSNSTSNTDSEKSSEWDDLDDIGYGPGICFGLKWADVRHLPELLGGEGASSGALKNVDEMVGKETKEE